MSGEWRGWQEQAGGTYAKDTTTLAPLADGQIASFARGADGNIYLDVHAFDSVWQGSWTFAGISLEAGDQVAVGRYVDGRLAAFARDTAGNIRCSRQADPADPHAWSAWAPVPGLQIASGDPLAVVATASGRLVLFARDSTGGLSCNRESSEGAWCGWASVPGLQAEHGDAFAAARAGDDRLVVANRQGAPSGAWSPHALNWQI